MNPTPSTPEDSPQSSGSSPARARSVLRLSFVVFVDKAHGEEELRPFFQSLEDTVKPLEQSWEVVAVDNSTSDETWDRLKSIQMDHRSRIHLIRFRAGQKRSVAAEVALGRVTGDVVFFLDTEHPEEIQGITQMANRVEEGYDVVIGQRESGEQPNCWDACTDKVFGDLLYQVNGLRLSSPLSQFFCFRTKVPRLSGADGERITILPYLAARAGFEVAEVPWKPEGPQAEQPKNWPFAQMPAYVEKLALSLWTEFRSASFLEATTPASMVMVFGAFFVTMAAFVPASLQMVFVAAGFLVITAALGALQLFNAHSIAELTSVYAAERVHQGAICEERHRVGTGIDHPASQEESKAVTPVDNGISAVEPGQAKPRVLVVDDDPMIQKLLSGILVDADCEVTSACDGEDGLSRVDDNTDVIILDLAMPRCDGFEFLKKYRSTSYDAKIIVISGSGRPKNVSKAFKEGAFDFMEKPFEIAETVRLVRNAVKQRRLAREYLEVA